MRLSEALSAGRVLLVLVWNAGGAVLAINQEGVGSYEVDEAARQS